MGREAASWLLPPKWPLDLLFHSRLFRCDKRLIHLIRFWCFQTFFSDILIEGHPYPDITAKRVSPPFIYPSSQSLGHNKFKKPVGEFHKHQFWRSVHSFGLLSFCFSISFSPSPCKSSARVFCFCTDLIGSDQVRSFCPTSRWIASTGLIQELVTLGLLSQSTWNEHHCVHK